MDPWSGMSDPTLVVLPDGVSATGID